MSGDIMIANLNLNKVATNEEKLVALVEVKKSIHFNSKKDTSIPSYLSAIEQEILSLSRDVHKKEVIDNNLKFMKKLASQNILRILIKEVLEDKNLLKTIAARSYEHVNHFDKIVLIDNHDPKGYRLTLHMWDNNYSKKVLEEELIHNHRFSFWSHVYFGNLVSENFIESKHNSIEKKDFNKFTYRPSTTGNIHSCVFTEKKQLTKLKNLCVAQGKTYYLNYRTIHRVLLPKKGHMLCTFVLRGPREREFTNTYNTFYPERGIQSSVPMMTPLQLKHKLVKLLGVIK